MLQATWDVPSLGACKASVDSLYSFSSREHEKNKCENAQSLNSIAILID